MTLKKTMMMTAAAVMLTATAAAAEGSRNHSEQYNYNQEGAAMDSSSDTAATMKSSTSSSDVSEISPAAGIDTTASADVTLSPSTIQSAQTNLKEEGYTVSVDGVWGPQTAAALREFQQQKGLNATGKLNTETMAALDIQQ